MGEIGIMAAIECNPVSNATPFTIRGNAIFNYMYLLAVHNEIQLTWHPTEIQKFLTIHH